MVAMDDSFRVLRGREAREALVEFG